jgi:hypothetical protein
LFHALINGRRRFLRRNNDMESNNACSLAEDVDRFLCVAGGSYKDSELFLQLNEEPVGDA